ncbi:MAG: YIP1 family protein [Deltaproteobacteria bacterium]|nr:YIP1 family protein [Deltaproteobacteria bacterium]
MHGAITHVLLMLFGGLRGGFEETVRVVAYSKVSSLVKMVPAAGSLVAWIWEIALQIIGLSRVHRIGSWKAAVAVLAPMFICCCGLIFMFGIFFTFIMALLGSGMTT